MSPNNSLHWTSESLAFTMAVPPGIIGCACCVTHRCFRSPVSSRSLCISRLVTINNSLEWYNFYSNGKENKQKWIRLAGQL